MIFRKRPKLIYQHSTVRIVLSMGCFLKHSTVSKVTASSFDSPPGSAVFLLQNPRHDAPPQQPGRRRRSSSPLRPRLLHALRQEAGLVQLGLQRELCQRRREEQGVVVGLPHGHREEEGRGKERQGKGMLCFYCKRPFLLSGLCSFHTLKL